MTLEELNYLVAKEADKLTEDNWYDEIVKVIENILRDHNMIPDDMTLHWVKRSILWDRDTVILYLPEAKLAFSLFNVETHKPNAPDKLKHIVDIFYPLLDTYVEHLDVAPVIDKAVIKLYMTKTDIEASEY